MSDQEASQTELQARWEAADPESPALRRQITDHYDRQGSRYKFVEEDGQALLVAPRKKAA